MSIRKLLAQAGDILYYKILEKELSNATSVLDVGCGSNSPIARIHKTFYAVGIDIFEPSIKRSKLLKIHDDYKLGNVLKIDELFKPKSYDVVIALDIIEHLNKKDGYKLIQMMELIAKKKVIMLTPHGFTKQNPIEKNSFQIHKSGWEINDFKKMGYKVHGIRGLKFIRGEYATIKYKPWIFWGVIASVSDFIVYFFPKIAHQLFVVKEIKE